MALESHEILQSQPPAQYASRNKVEVPVNHQTIKKIAKIALGAMAGSVLNIATSGAIVFAIGPLDLTGTTHKFITQVRDGTPLKWIIDDFKELSLMKKVAVLTALFIYTAILALGLTATIIVSPVAMPAMLAIHGIIGGIIGGLHVVFPEEFMPTVW